MSVAEVLSQFDRVELPGFPPARQLPGINKPPEVPLKFDPYAHFIDEAPWSVEQEQAIYISFAALILSRMVLDDVETELARSGFLNSKRRDKLKKCRRDYEIWRRKIFHRSPALFEHIKESLTQSQFIGIVNYKNHFYNFAESCKCDQRNLFACQFTAVELGLIHGAFLTYFEVAHRELMMCLDYVEHVSAVLDGVTYNADRQVVVEDDKDPQYQLTRQAFINNLVRDCCAAWDDFNKKNAHKLNYFAF